MRPWLPQGSAGTGVLGGLLHKKYNFELYSNGPHVEGRRSSCCRGFGRKIKQAPEHLASRFEGRLFLRELLAWSRRALVYETVTAGGSEQLSGGYSSRPSAELELLDPFL